MKKKETVRNYNFGDAHLITEASRVLDCIRRDINEFNTRGWNPTEETQWMTLLDEFDMMPTDDELEGIKMEKTAIKVEKRDIVEVQCRNILNMASKKYRNNQPRVKRFGEQNFSQMSDEQILRAAKHIYRTASTFLIDLQTEGLTNVVLDNLKQAYEDLDEAMSDQKEAISDRDVATEERIEKGNQLYEFIMSWASVGKTLFYTTSEAKYNDYLLHEGFGAEEEQATYEKKANEEEN